MSVTPSGGAAPYSLISQREDTWYDPKLDTVVDGWIFRVQWLDTSAVFTVRVPGTPPSAAAVDKAIRDAGGHVAAYDNLGA